MGESYTLHHGDCLDVMPTLEAGSIDMVLCDLPYGMTSCAWDNVISMPRLWSTYERLLRLGGAVALFGCEPFSSRVRLSHSSYRFDWYWKKNLPSGIGFAKSQPMRVIETISIFAVGPFIYNKQPTKTIIADRKVIDGRSNGSGSNGSNHYKMRQVANIQQEQVNPRNLLDFRCVPNAGGKKLHPTQKPTDLLEYLILTHTNEGDTVLDNTMGSGSTGVACLNTGRRFVGIEKDEGYFAIAKDRLRKAEERRAQTPIDLLSALAPSLDPTTQPVCQDGRGR